MATQTTEEKTRYDRLMRMRDLLKYPDIEALKDDIIEKALVEFEKSFPPGTFPAGLMPLSDHTVREIEEIERNLRQPPPNILVGAPLWDVHHDEDGDYMTSEHPVKEDYSSEKILASADRLVGPNVEVAGRVMGLKAKILENKFLAETDPKDLS